MPRLQERETDRLGVTKAVSKVRAKMPISQRAKQFAPFDAVVGLRAALKEKEQIKVEPKTVSDDMENEINNQLKNLKIGDVVTVIYYDTELQNYSEVNGKVKLINKKEIEILNTRIEIKDIYEIKK